MSTDAAFPLSDAQLLDFNAAHILLYSDEETREYLERFGDAFRYQLVGALQLDEWAANLEDDPIASMDPVEVRGWVNALRNVAAILRQGNYLPGGSLFEGVVRDRRSEDLQEGSADG